ncbi:MAG TPA: hypothetical protein DCQ92_01135 [Verrucomicrobia subdivision 3 bacterium]|nr:hypothetical protein [Limisphaerales bacterium]
MTCTVRNFDRFVLTPIFWSFNIAAVVFLIGFHWWWLASAILGSFYTGIIGQMVHPKQTVSDLTQGSVTGAAATREEIGLSELQHRVLVSQACTHVGILSGVTIGIVLGTVLGWRWYFAAIVGFICLVFIGAILKVLFRSV